MLLILPRILSSEDWLKTYLSVGRQAATRAVPDSTIDQKRIRLMSSDDGQ